MDPDIYKAAAKGNITAFEDNNLEQPIEASLTPNKNTVLHIFITSLKNGEELAEDFVGKILDKCSSLLCQVNVKDETPLHVAARYGHADIVKVLIQNAKNSHLQHLESESEAVKRMLRMVTKEKDTALHEAVRYNHLKVIKLLIDEDRDFAYSVNDAGETPLYIAAERNYKDMVLEILNTCNSPSYDGPIGRTALHAAVLSGNEVTVKAIMDKFGGAITEKKDEKGCTPLHLAAYSGRDSCAKTLLERDSQVAYMKDKEGRTALHIAAHEGNYLIMKGKIDKCPDCCELVDNRGWNAILHFAVVGDGPILTVAVILENSSLCNLLNEKNAEGNTPFHHQYSLLLKRIQSKNLMDHPRVDKMAFNKNNLNAYQLALTNANIQEIQLRALRRSKLQSYPRRLIKTKEEEDYEVTRDEDLKTKKKWEARREESLEKAAEAHLVVAALITTVTFAAAITMPGGFVGTGGNHEGSAILRRNAAFKVFIITDAISLVLSSSGVFIHLLITLLSGSFKLHKTRSELLILAFWFILLAMVAMVLAFITGAYAVLAHSSNLAITTCVIGSSFFLIIFLCYLCLGFMLRR